MYVSTMDVDDAVLRVFAELRVPVGRRLAYATLVKQWPRRALRHADLAEAVQRLVRLHLLEAQRQEDGHFLVLTSDGQKRVEELTALAARNWAWRLRMSVLQTWRSLLAGSSHPDRRRRLRDRIAPQLPHA